MFKILAILLAPVIVFVIVAVIIPDTVWSQDKDFGHTKLKNCDKYTDQETPNYDWKVDRPNAKYFSRGKHDKPEFKIEKKGSGLYVGFELLDPVNKVMELEFNPDGIKETTTILSGKAGLCTLRYIVKTNLTQWSFANERIVYYNIPEEILYVTPGITANLANGIDSTDVLIEYYKDGNNLCIVYDGSYGYPIEIDPTIEIILPGILNVNFDCAGGTKDANRNGASALTNGTAAFAIGFVGDHPRTGRHKWDLTGFDPDTMLIISVTINYYLTTNGSTTDFLWGIFLANPGSTPNSPNQAEWQAFPGYVDNAAYTNKIHLGSYVNTSAASALNNYGNIVTFTQTGIDTFSNHLGGILYTMTTDSIYMTNGIAVNGYMTYSGSAQPAKMNFTYALLTPTPSGDVLTGARGTIIREATGRQTSAITRKNKFVNKVKVGG